MSFKEVDPKQSFPKLEEEILKFWQDNNIFKKSLEKDAPSGDFVFYEGPPTANGKPGIHHIIGRAFKDLIPRYKTMQGYRVKRKAGWDTHGLPVEIEVEKQLGISGKDQIENYGVAKFNAKCRESVWTYKQEWEKMTERIGFWVDLKNPYITYENSYIENVWGVLKQIWDKDLIYSGFKVVPYCPRCGTTLSSHEVAQGYKNIEDQSVYIKFPVEGQANKYFLVWTTTPWTLPANIALAINVKFKYSQIKINDEILILASNRLKVIQEKYEIIKEIDGQDLVGTSYEPLYDISAIANLNSEKDYKIWAADFVSDSDGTGIVHIAPSFGIDDKDLQDKYGFSAPVTIKADATMITKIGQGKFVKDADIDIKTDLLERNLLYKEEKIKHEYPFCWRCDSMLIYFAKQTWFIKMSQLRDKLLANNENINWIPAYIKNGRFGEWLKDAKDWALSRERYWGTPLPIWQCDCGAEQMIGSIKELKEKAINNVPDDLDLHKPYVDDIKIKCDQCGHTMSRVSEVIDVWFDSGAMPFASGEYPDSYPADYITEAIDQTRGWFYTMLAISTCLDKPAPYKNVICYAHILDETGKKMSKSKGNIISPWEVLDEFGADSVRWFFYTVNDPGMPKRMSARNIEQTLRQFILMWWNVYSFFITYSNIDKWSSSEIIDSTQTMDIWIESKFNELTVSVAKDLDGYNIVPAARSMQEFMIELSTWYLRRSRKRRDAEFYSTLYKVLFGYCKIVAPFVPFTAEEIYQNLKMENDIISVHLASWPKQGNIDQDILDQMNNVRVLVEKAHALRAEAKMRLRQPLASATIKIDIDENLQEILKDEINVKEIKIDKNITDDIKLDTCLTVVLQEEGELRDLIRQIQDLRKKSGLSPSDKIELFYRADSSFSQIIKKFTDQIQAETNISEIKIGEDSPAGGDPIWLGEK